MTDSISSFSAFNLRLVLDSKIKESQRKYKERNSIPGMSRRKCWIREWRNNSWHFTQEEKVPKFFRGYWPFMSSFIISSPFFLFLLQSLPAGQWSGFSEYFSRFSSVKYRQVFVSRVSHFLSEPQPQEKQTKYFTPNCFFLLLNVFLLFYLLCAIWI